MESLLWLLFLFPFLGFGKIPWQLTKSIILVELKCHLRAGMDTGVGAGQRGPSSTLLSCAQAVASLGLISHL